MSYLKNYVKPTYFKILFTSISICIYTKNVLQPIPHNNMLTLAPSLSLSITFDLSLILQGVCCCPKKRTHYIRISIYLKYLIFLSMRFSSCYICYLSHSFFLIYKLHLLTIHFCFF